MQQLYLTGSHAALIADRLFTALNVRPVGYRLTPFSVEGASRGEALRLLLPPAAGHNDVPCRIRISADRSVIVPAALEEVAAPGLHAALRVHAPLLLGGVQADLLDCPAFREAVRACLMSSRPVIVVADEAAAPVLRALTPPETQLWFAVPEDEAGQAALLESLLPEAMLRF
ncbi:MAG: hypothetical protein IJ343_09375 [Clostridia bacterium]|nr:hypothetical protein [Clostridia bacterium]